MKVDKTRLVSICIAAGLTGWAGIGRPTHFSLPTRMMRGGEGPNAQANAVA